MPAPLRAARKALFAAAAAAFALGLAEAGLRLGGYGWKSEARGTLLQYLDQSLVFRRDRELFWTYHPGRRVRPFGPADPFEVAIDAEGFRAGTLENGTFRLGADGARPAGGVVVAAFGDSCTFGGGVPWTERLERRLFEAGAPARVLNYGVQGYSSLQGLRLARRKVAEIRPGAVTIWFGNNDSVGNVIEDVEVAIPSGDAWIAQRILRRSRLFLFLEARIAATRRAEVPAVRERVPLDPFRANLRDLAALARAAGARPILVASAATAGRADWKILDYNRAVREVAHETGADLLDLEARFQGDLVARGMEADGIHPTDDGEEWIAGWIAELVRPPAR